MSSTIKPVYFMAETPATEELGVGTIIGPVRVLAVDKIAASSTCRKQRWDFTDDPRIHMLMGFYALRRLGLTDAADFDQFQASIADYAVTNTLDEDQDDDEDPTTRGSSS